jgi:hypothetical protein
MNESGRKYTFDTLEIERKCYLLLTCFFASREIHEYCAQNAKRNIDFLSVYEPIVIQDLLIFLAIRLRMIDDLMRSHGRKHRLLEHKVGEYYYEKEKRKKPLLIREACNKIIHAKSIVFDELQDGLITHLRPHINLSGTQERKPWVAAINVKPFVAAALFMAVQYDEDWEVSRL